VAERTSLDIPAEKLEDDPPILVAFELQNKYRESAKLDGNEPMGTVKKIAGEKHVPLRPIADYSALDMIKEALRLPLAAQQICLDESLANWSSVRLTLRLWPKLGRLATSRRSRPNYAERGFQQMPQTGAELWTASFDQAVKDYLAAVDNGLSKPGKTVMLVDIGDLLRDTGVAAETAQRRHYRRRPSGVESRPDCFGRGR